MPSVANLFQKGALRWMPDTDAVNAADGVLLRARNLVPDVAGSLSLRRGSTKLYTSLGTSINVLHTAELADGTTYRAAGVDDTIVINGVTSYTNLAGSGDMAVGNDSHQLFFARGSDKKKYDGTTMHNWSIPQPSEKVTLTAVATTTSTVADFNNSESPAVTIAEGTGTVGGEADQDGNTNEATDLTALPGTGRGVLQRLFTSDQDFFDIASVEGTETDLLDFYLKFDDVSLVQKVKIVFGADDSSTIPFKDNRFEFEFNLADNIPIQLKDPVSEGYAAYNDAVQRLITGINPADVGGFKTPQEVRSGLSGVGETPSSASNAPGDNVWSHLTISRGQFKRIGNDAARGWNTIRGFKLILSVKKSKTVTMTVSDAKIVGGGDRALNGTYKCVIVGVRQVSDPATGKPIYYEKSPPSDESASINLNHQTLQITLPNRMLNSLDSQIDQLWIYLYGGWLDTYYRFAVVPSSITQGMSIDELVDPVGSDMNTVVKRMRIPSWGFTYSQLNTDGIANVTAATTIAVKLRTSEMDALVANETLEPYQIAIPDNVVAIAGPWRGRQFILTREGYVYPTAKSSSASINSLQLIDLSRFGDSMWIAKTGNGIYVGMETDIIFISGSAEETPDGTRIDLRAQELNVGNPPVDSSHWVEGNSVLYRSTDGLMELTGGSLKPVPPAGTSLLWRGQDRHGVLALNTGSGRFRMAMDNGMLYMLAPEGLQTSGNVIYRYSFPLGQWSRLVFDQVGTFLSIFNNPDGSLLAGDGAGTIWTLEDTFQDNTFDIPVEVLTPIMDGGHPLSYKDPFDLQIHLDTYGSDFTATIFPDGNTTGKEFTVTTNGNQIWRADASGIGKFVKSQLQMTGHTSRFTLSMFNLTHRLRPQRMTYFDTGSVVPSPGGDVVWPQEVELDAISDSSTVTMKLYFNDVLSYTTTIAPTTGIRDVHQIPLPRGAKGERPRVVFFVDDDQTTGDVGFDPYMVRLRLVGSGNQDRDRNYLPMYPVGQAS